MFLEWPAVIGIVIMLTARLVGYAAVGEPLAATNAPTMRTYTVGKKIAEFPTNEDLSTPEAAYATLQRAFVAEGDAVWQRLSVRSLAEAMSPAEKKPLPAEIAECELNAEVIEVCFGNETSATVFARMQLGNDPKNLGIDLRSFGLEDGHWLNSGEDVAGNLEDARKKFARRCASFEAGRRLFSRAPITNPGEYLRPFVEFLQREAVDPKEFILQALACRRVVILGEVHHRPRYWAFDAALVRATNFWQKVGVLYLELPSNDQPLVDQFLAARKYNPQPVIDMLRDNLWMGWPDQPMLEFFKAVWEVNQPLPKENRLRIVAVDMARPWKEIKARDDWRKYDVDRDQFMAENVARDLLEHASDSRHALFIVGYMHAMVNFTSAGGEAVKSAGWHLREMMGESNVFAVFPHSPVMSNMGDVKGRIGLGLFESAFAALTNRPMAFPLDHGPFGGEIFDASLDFQTADPFRNGYHAYLYLGPLEDESFSPLIPGFYTDDFVQELDRRQRIMNGKGLVEGGVLPKLDTQSFLRWMSDEWGQPRYEWTVLGPLDAWQLGSDWDKKVRAARKQNWTNETSAIQQAAARLFEVIRSADYDNPGDWRSFPAPDVDYQVNSDYPGWVRWVCQHFRTNPVVTVELGEVSAGPTGWPTIPYRLIQKDGAVLKGNLSFEWGAYAQRWGGVVGLDWHQREARNTTAGAAQSAPQSTEKSDTKQRLAALVEDFFANNWHDLTARETLEWGDITTAENGSSSIRYKYRAITGDQNTVTNNQVFTFDPQDKLLTVKDVKSQ